MNNDDLLKLENASTIMKVMNSLGSLNISQKAKRSKKHGDSPNIHTKKYFHESKKRRKMAAASRKRNRK